MSAKSSSSSSPAGPPTPQHRRPQDERPPQRRRRRRRRGLRIVLAVVVVLLVVLGLTVLFLPSLASTGPGKSFIQSVINQPGSDLSITLGEVDLGWSGEQVFRDLHIRRADGSLDATLTVATQGSLFAWITGSRDFGVIQLSGTVEAVLPEQPAEAEDESTEDDPMADPFETIREALANASVPEGLDATLEITDLDVLVRNAIPGDPAAGAPMGGTAELRDLTGRVHLATGDPVTLNLAAATRVGDQPGQFAATGTINNLIAPSGGFTADAADWDLSIDSTNLPTGVIDALANQQGRLAATLGSALTIKAGVNGVSDRTVLAIDMNAPRAEVVLNLTAANGRLQTQDNTSNRASLTLRPETLDLWTASDEEGDPSLLPRLEAETTARVTIDRLDWPLPWAADPAVTGAGLVATVETTPLRLDTSGLAGPPEDGAGGAGGVQSVIARDLRLGIASTDVTQRIEITMNGRVASVTAAVGGAGASPATEGAESPIEGRFNLLNPLTSDGRFAASTLGVEGELTARSIPAATIDAFLPVAGVGAQDLAGPQIDEVRLTAAIEGAGGETPATRIEFAARSPRMMADAAALLEGGVVHSVTGTPARVTLANLDPEVVDRMLAGPDDDDVPVEPGAARTQTEIAPPSQIELVAESFAIPLGDEAGGMAAASFVARLTTRGGGVTLTEFPADADVAAGTATGPRVTRVALADVRLTLQSEALGEAVTGELDARAALGEEAFALNGRFGGYDIFTEDSRRYTLSADVPEAPVEAVATLAGGDMGPSLREALGQGAVRARLTAQLSPEAGSANVNIGSDEASAEFVMRANLERIEIGGEAAIALTPALADRWLPADGGYRLIDRTQARIAVESIVIPRRTADPLGPGVFAEAADGWQQAAMGVAVALANPAQVLTPQLVAPVSVTEFTARANFPQGLSGSGEAVVDAVLTSADRSQPLTRAELAARLRPLMTADAGAGAAAEPGGDAAESTDLPVEEASFILRNVNVPLLEQVTGRPVGQLVDAIGRRGTLQAQLTPIDAGTGGGGDGGDGRAGSIPLAATINAQFDRLQADLAARIDEQQTFALTRPATLTATLDRTYASQFLASAPDPAAGGDTPAPGAETPAPTEAPEAPLAFGGDVRINATLTAFTFSLRDVLADPAEEASASPLPGEALPLRGLDELARDPAGRLTTAELVSSLSGRGPAGPGGVVLAVQPEGPTSDATRRRNATEAAQPVPAPRDPLAGFEEELARGFEDPVTGEPIAGMLPLWMGDATLGGTVEISPVRLLQGTTPLADLRGFRLGLTEGRLSTGLPTELAATIAPPAPGDGPASGAADAASAGRLSVQGTLATMTRGAGLNPVFTGEGTAVDVPTIVLDQFTDMGGRLVGLVGSVASAEADFSAFGIGSGTARLNVRSTYGTLTAEELQFGADRLVFTRPLTAQLQLTRPMVETVLSEIHPMLYDLQRKTGPVSFQAQTLSIPLDGDLRKFGGQFILDPGQVLVSSKGIIGTMLGEIASEQPNELAATVPPITIDVVDGVLSYQGLTLQTAQFAIETGGDVDLVERQLNLTAAVPLIGWKQAFGEMVDIDLPILRNLQGNVPFYLKITGPIDKPKIYPDPEGAQRVAKNFFQNVGVESGRDVGRVLNDVLGGVLNNRERREERERQERIREEQEKQQGGGDGADGAGSGGDGSGTGGSGTGSGSGGSGGGGGGG